MTEPRSTSRPLDAPVSEPGRELPTGTPQANGARDSGDELAAALAERDDNFQRFLRSQAELENYRKRVQRERDEERRYAALSVVRDLLPAIDNLHRALEAAKAGGNVGDLTQGIDLVLKQLDDVLARHGAKPIDAEGKPFDPNLHAALTQVPTSEHPPLTVLQEVERGYVLHDRVVRPSRVIVSAGPPEARGGDGAQRSPSAVR
jgi:molecular chaperone GrpE